eukprot:TRINITY_DN5027_c0_g1_i1.p1 TRINITY_DN5027_c0_g1~~TRINITY_DN5027_c0_g1_i1.p1  ORF type:complete len:547 (+),score=89.24 TRINITY_DN5027_c0_g1_i1:45-1643(+)
MADEAQAPNRTGREDSRDGLLENGQRLPRETDPVLGRPHSDASSSQNFNYTLGANPAPSSGGWGRTVLLGIGILVAFGGGVAISPWLASEGKAIMNGASSGSSTGASSGVHSSGKSAKSAGGADAGEDVAPQKNTTTFTSTLTTTQTITATTVTRRPYPKAPYSCKTDLNLGPVMHGAKKGMAIDDTTFSQCPSDATVNWPNAKQNISSIRLFKAWDPYWFSKYTLDRLTIWKELREYVWKNNVKILFGTQITCNETADDNDWSYVRELMLYIGSKYAMGLAVGNEVELIHTKANMSKKCADRIFSGGYFARKVYQRAADLNSMPGLSNLPLTSVMGGYVLAGDPFINTKECGVLSFHQKMNAHFGKRWVYTWNVYPYFDPRIAMDDGPYHTCSKALMSAVNFAPQSLLPTMLKVLRQRTAKVTGRKDDITWLGETGWSWPQASTLNTNMAACKSFSTQEAMSLYYQGFLEWDLSLGWEVPPIDHAFFFTMRDAVNFNVRENFGLVEGCENTHCKLQTEALSEDQSLDEALE